MTVDTLKEQVEETLGTTKKSFQLGELRILCALFLLLLLSHWRSSSLRPSSSALETSEFCWPETSTAIPHKILVKFTLEFTKTYLGTKDA